MENTTQQKEKAMAGMHKLPAAVNIPGVKSDRSEAEIAKARMKALSIIARVFSCMALLCMTLTGCSKDDKEELPQPAASKISGTVQAVAGQMVAGTYVIACYNNDCEDEKSKHVQLTENQASASFEIKDLPAGKYSVVAWKDINANSELDAGDGIGFVSANGNDPDLISPPKEGLTMQMTTMAGAGGNPVAAGSIAGTVAAPAGHSVAGTIVIACQWNGSECVEATSDAVQVQANGTYSISGLAAQPYFIIAWKDLNNNGSVDNGDLYGLHVKDGSIGSVLPPSQGIAVTMALTSSQGGTSGGGNGTVPANLVGEWIRGTASAVDFYNPSTGSWAAPSGLGMFLELFADGRFEFSTVAQVTNYNCTTQVTTFYRGTAVFNGNQVTLEPSYTRQKFNSNCFSQHNSDKVVPNSPLPFTWRAGTGSNGKQELVLIWPDGTESAFSRP